MIFIKMSLLNDLLEKTLSEIWEIMPWNLVDQMAENSELIVISMFEVRRCSKNEFCENEQR
ncbi:MAG TPA: hypothetical protein DEB17_09600 [Chlorobaculum sp.]|uniref:Uncharacterized protein n=1 Tax=Chlorobaculum tepidum (strain ATCC 49652 / DSM 12025 / NBRC 103806 / TLS) TaxID=194439 RepID=Q8KAB4_CHLTE|nr:hypothetical protein CT2252 [Chlorobaculum tepidum TLS]HBU24222.1 hypothetical protein [Chlorobaculum sp.]